MNLKGLNEYIKSVSLRQKSVHEYNEGDVYENLNNGEHKYGNVVLTINSLERNVNTLDVHCYLFYVDRLLEDNSNKLDIWTVGVNTLQSILNQLEYTDGFTGYSDVIFTNFTEQFNDLCAGVYIDVVLTIINEMEDTCVEDE